MLDGASEIRRDDRDRKTGCWGPGLRPSLLPQREREVAWPRSWQPGQASPAASSPYLGSVPSPGGTGEGMAGRSGSPMVMSSHRREAMNRSPATASAASECSLGCGRRRGRSSPRARCARGGRRRGGKPRRRPVFVVQGQERLRQLSLAHPDRTSVSRRAYRQVLPAEQGETLACASLPLLSSCRSQDIRSLARPSWSARHSSWPASGLRPPLR